MTSFSPQGAETLSSATQSALGVYPNPVVQFATVSFSLARMSPVKISIVDISGKLLKTIADQNFSEGSHQVKFSRQSLRAGVFFLQIKTNEGVMMKKIVIE